MGLEQGLYCVGCCWVLMGLLFVGGVMNLMWIAAITAFILVEINAPFGVQAGRFSGLMLIICGALVIGLS
jgi:predicted metal-binding membrane protein